jgi:maltooligosyltrehalose trehalohydrolase
MTAFSVWAPHASRVEVALGPNRHPMQQAGGGWWSADVDASPGADYGFSLDGEQPLPDPRSAWQPAGVHGLSRLVDHAAFAWQVPDWRGCELPGSVLYELHIGTFTPEGSFDAAISKLDDLVELGVDVIEVLPVAAFPGRHGWGYDGVFPYAVQESYGGPEGLKRFVDACHLRGLGVVLDVVYNHLGPDGNVLPRYGPYFTDSYATPWGQAVNYSGPDSDDVRSYVIENALMWLRDYQFDGLRLDAVHAIIDTSAIHLLEELAVEVGRLAGELGRPLWLIAESDLNDPRIVSAREVGGYGVDAQWSDDFHHALHAALTGETFGYYEDFGALTDLGVALRQGFVYAGRYSKHRRRRHGRPLPATISSHRLLGYAQNHDQIGNRAKGERLAALVSPGLAKVAAALVLTGPFTPMLFMGEEWAASAPWQYFTDHGDPSLAESVRVGRRGEFSSFGWKPDDVPDPGDPETFRRSILDWTERTVPPHDEILRWHRELISLRRARADLRSGCFDDVRVNVDETARTITMARADTMVLANCGRAPRDVQVGGYELLLASDAGAAVAEGRVTVPGESVAILGRSLIAG